MRLSIYETIVGDNNIPEDIKAKTTEYKLYIDEHISNVSNAWQMIKENNKIIDYICTEGECGHSLMIPTIDTVILSHDISKYGIDEFEPYRKYFYPVDEAEKQSADAEFDRAWIHHYMTNMHHPEYWKDRIDDIPLIVVVEMCCDWIAMSMKFGGTAYDWFHDKNKCKYEFGDTQAEWIEFILKSFYNK